MTNVVRTYLERLNSIFGRLPALKKWRSLAVNTITINVFSTVSVLNRASNSRFSTLPVTQIVLLGYLINP